MQKIEVSRIYRWFVSRSKFLKWGIKLSLTILFVYIVNRTLTFNQLRELFCSISIPHLALALVLGGVGVLFQTLRWHRVLRCCSFETSLWCALKTMLWGSLLGFITPGRSGELLRAIELEENRKADSVLASILDRGYAIIFALIFGIVGFSVQMLVFQKTPEKRLLFASLALVPVFFLLVFLLRYKGGALCKKNPLKWVRQRFGILRSSLNSALGKRILFHSFAAHVVLLIQTAILFDMFGYGDFLLSIVAVSQAYAFMVFMPFFVANVGIREYSMALFMVQIGAVSYSMEIKAASAGVSTLVLLINIFLPALAGLFWVVSEKRIKKTAPQIQNSTSTRMLRESGYGE